MGRIQHGRWETHLRRAMSAKEGGLLPETMPELQPVYVIEGDRPEHALLAGELLCAGSIATAVPAGGNTARIQLRNPVDSGVLAVVEFIWAQASGPSYLGIAQEIVVTIPNAVLVLATPSTSAGFRDTRISLAQGRTTCVLEREESAAALPVGAQLVIVGKEQNNAANNNTVNYVQPVILGPGSSIHLNPTETAKAIRASFAWRERPAEASELSV